MRADLDAFLFLAQIARTDNNAMLEMAAPNRGGKGTNELATCLMDQFKAELRQKRYETFDTEPLPPDEAPEEI